LRAARDSDRFRHEHASGNQGCGCGLSLGERRELREWLSEAADMRAADLEDLKREIQIGLDDLEQGRFGPVDMEEIKREGRARMQTKA
jgi:hypothetical protein